MNKNSNLLEVKEYKDEGYEPLIDYEKWRVAVLNYCDELLPKNINKMQKHNKTDEVFVLLQGNCILFISDGNEEIGNIKAIDMEPLKVYNIKKSVWHTHTLSEDAVVLIVENENTCLKNSPEECLLKKHKDKIIELSNIYWS